MNVKVFNVITRIYEAKIMIKHISCDCRCKFNSTTCHSNKNHGIMINVNVNEKTINFVKKIIVRTLVHALVRIVSF